MKALFRWYEKSKNKIDPVMLAGLVHAKLYLILLFDNGNGRINRLALNFVLYEKGLPMFAFPEVRSEIAVYIKVIRKTRETKDVRKFLKWFSCNTGDFTWMIENMKSSFGSL